MKEIEQPSPQSPNLPFQHYIKYEKNLQIYSDMAEHLKTSWILFYNQHCVTYLFLLFKQKRCNDSI